MECINIPTKIRILYKLKLQHLIFQFAEAEMLQFGFRVNSHYDSIFKSSNRTLLKDIFKEL